MKLTFLSPTLPPQVCGVGDHTVRLAEALRDRVDGISAIYTRGEQISKGLPFDLISRWDGQPANLATLIDEHGTDCLWLQYSGYGFAYQGLPAFLARSLERLPCSVKLAVFFHQIHCRAGQLGWKGILIAPRQRNIARRIARKADIVMTSCELYRQAISHEYEVDSSRLHQLPIGSNIPLVDVTAAERDRVRGLLGWSPEMKVAIAFGSQGTQKKALVANMPLLTQAAAREAIQRIVCVGGSPGAPPLELAEICSPIVRSLIVDLGYQEEKRIAELLLASDVAITGNVQSKFGKSGTIMAFAMAGLPVLVADRRVASKDIGEVASFVRTVSIADLMSAAADLELRKQQQRLAHSHIGWTALAERALSILTSQDLTISGVNIRGN